MRAPIRPWLVVAIAAVVVVLPVAASGAPSSPTAPIATSANSTTYQDSQGENPGAPDITTLTVSNTDAGMLSFRVAIPNRPQFTQDMLLLLFVDSDANAQTGDPEELGADYVIEIFGGEAALFRWDGTTFSRRAGDPPATSLVFNYQGGVTVNISAAELGNTKRLRFSFIAISNIAIDPTTSDLDFTNAVGDIAPAANAGLYEYEVRITPATLVVRSLKPTPARPAAGRAFTLRLTAVRSDTNAAVQNGRVTCVGRIGNARVAAQVQRVIGRAAVCTWNIPARAGGKSFRGTVSLTFEGLRAAQSYTARVR